MTKTITLRPAEPERDFGQLAALFSLEQAAPTSEASLRADYKEHKAQIIRLMVAEDKQGELLGFNWAWRTGENQVHFYLIVKPEQRGQGAGRRLYEDVEQVAKAAQVEQLRIDIRDDCPKCLTFATRCGFSERSHTIRMALDLDAFDDRPYSAVIARLQAEGFEFTSMQALGNTEEAQRKLYALNDMTASDRPEAEGEHAWPSFDDFRKQVCQANWYKPDGQMLAIETASGAWVGLSAITRFEGSDHAYNLHTGVDRRYRGRKLAQALKVLALRYAREVLQMKTVHTTHDILNNPMIAIDRKFGYVQIPGFFSMEKVLNVNNG